MDIELNYSLKPYNTFGIAAAARYFAAFASPEELGELLETELSSRHMILGGGSNVLFTGDYDGLVLKNEIKGIDIVKEDSHHVYIQAGAGENWHDFVLYCLDRSLAGVENLSLIPGSVGASPMQNIGAYGVEVREVFHELEAFHLREKKTFTFSNTDCEFGYRESVFKNRMKEQFAIMQVTFRLNKVASLNTSYGALEQELEKMGGPVTIQAVSQAVIHIRRSKLPDPLQIGNAGSFFKNPVVTPERYQELKKEYPGLPGYPQENGSVKLAAGWLVEYCGWKGYRRGDAGCHAKQALVLVNYGNATGRQIYELSEDILKSVRDKFGITLEREVNIL